MSIYGGQQQENSTNKFGELKDSVKTLIKLKSQIHPNSSLTNTKIWGISPIVLF